MALTNHGASLYSRAAHKMAHFVTPVGDTQNAPAPQPSYARPALYIGLILGSLVLLGGLLLLSSRILRSRKKRNATHIVDVHVAEPAASFRPPAIIAPPPAARFTHCGPTLIHEPHLNCDAQYLAYVNQGKMLSGNGRAFFV
ncbi:hypothetical protein B0H11DRAFT_2236397 [Mycena galericulata]|nr:hypothetical protein B0H11DRAFT_2236397 [Mycena galericulata]